MFYHQMSAYENVKLHSFPSLTSAAIFQIMIIVKRLIQSDLTKILLFLILTTVCAAAITPLLYDAGKMIAEVAEARSRNPIVTWFAQKCGQANLPQYFNRGLLLCALLLAGPFLMWLRLGKEARQPRRNPWRIRLPNRSIAQDQGQPLVRNPKAKFHFTTGFLLAGSLMLLMVWLLLQTGWFALIHPIDWISVTRSSIFSAAFTGVIEEWIFRGVILGILLRSMRPTMAIVTTSLFFASVHFLIPLDGVTVLKPGDLDSGFRLISLIIERFSHPQTFFFGFIYLFAMGLILAYARYRTSSLWLPMGLHIGGLFIHRLFHQTAEFSGEHLASVDVFIGHDRQSGILPLTVLIAMGLLVHVFAQVSAEKLALAD